MKEADEHKKTYWKTIEKEWKMYDKNKSKIEKKRHEKKHGKEEADEEEEDEWWEYIEEQHEDL